MTRILEPTILEPGLRSVDGGHHSERRATMNTYTPPSGQDRTIYRLVIVLLAAIAFVGWAWWYTERDDEPATSPEGVTVNDQPADQAPPCDQLAGLPTMDVVGVDGTGGGACNNGGSTEILVSASYGCPDGRRLYWNDFGWGYSDAQWQAHARPDGQLIPPDQDMATCNQR